MKFYEFKNITKESADIFVYGEIVSDTDDWFGSDTDVALMDFKQQLDKIGNVNTLNMYINSPGGDVFVASTMISMLQRLKDNGTTINAYVDGLSASAASFLMFVADNINLYNNSIVMIHRPMSIAMGNADDFQNMIDTLNKLEDSIIIPMYMKKAQDNVDEATIKQLLADESWLDADDMAKYFNVNLLDESKQAVACIDSKLFKNYKRIPLQLRINIDKEKDKLEDEKKAESIKQQALKKARAKLKLQVINI